MSGVRKTVMGASEDGDGGSRSGVASGRPEGGREVRWSARRKAEVVVRLLRGEGLDALARETGQAAGSIAGWREEFLQAGHEGLKSRPAPVEDRRRVTRSASSVSSRWISTSSALNEEMDRRPRSPRR